MAKKNKNKNKKPNMVIRDAIYVPIETVNHEHIDDHYTNYLYDEKVCSTCDNMPERHNYICDSCPIGGFSGIVKLSACVNKNGTTYVKMPIGDRHKLETLFGIEVPNYNVVDKRTSNKFRQPIKFTGSLRDYQEEPTDTILDKRYGLLMSPPRSGKTMMGIYMAVKSGMRTIIVANQYDFLQGFEEHLEKFTNILELEEKTGKKLYGFPKDLEDFDKFEICLCTYQQFIKEGTGTKRMQALNKNYGFFMVDECHRGNSTTFSQIISKVASTYKVGLSATPERKDGREFIVEALIGPVQYEVKIPTLVPIIHLHNTECAPKNHYAQWVAAMQYLSKNNKRNAYIMQWVRHDLKKGRSIVIPVNFKAHVEYLVDTINEQFGSVIAEPFVGGGTKLNKQNRTNVINNCRSRKTRVIVGIRSLMQLGLNVEQWSALYVVIPISNAPNWKQESSRILTPLEGKRPIIRMFVDIGMGQSTGCFRNTYRHSMELGYKLSEKSRAKLGKFMAGGRKQKGDDSHEYAAVKEDGTPSRVKMWGGN